MFDNRVGFSKYFRNTLWMLIEQVLRIVSGILVGVLVARKLGPDQFGMLCYVTAFVVIVGSVARMGVDGVVIRGLVRAPGDRNILLGTAFWLKMFGGVTAVVCLIAVVLLLQMEKDVARLIILANCSLLFQCFDVVDCYFQSRVLSKVVSICKIVQLCASVSLRVYFVECGGGCLILCW